MPPYEEERQTSPALQGGHQRGELLEGQPGARKACARHRNRWGTGHPRGAGPHLCHRQPAPQLPAHGRSAGGSTRRPLPSLTKRRRPRGDLSQTGLCSRNLSLFLGARGEAPRAPPAHRAAARVLQMLFTWAAMTGSSSTAPGQGKDLCFTLHKPLSPCCLRHHQLRERALFRAGGPVRRPTMVPGRSFTTFHFCGSVAEQEGRGKTICVCLGPSTRGPLNQVRTGWVIE